MRRILTAILDLALPRTCVRCESLLGDLRSRVCARCWAAVRVLEHPRCLRCGHPTHGTRCEWCRLLPDFVDTARSVCWVPDGAGGDLVHKLKYDDWPALGDDLGERMARTIAPVVGGAGAWIVPVPLSAARRRERGYNQSHGLARALAEAWGVALNEDVLVRRRHTQSQVLLTPAQRSANVHGAFAAGPAAAVARGGHIVLVDDVVTTAATLNACAAAVRAAGATTISYVTFGRAHAAFDRTTHHRSA